MARMPRFREYSPLSTAIVGVAVVSAMLVLAFSIPTLTRGTTYTAVFSEAGGLNPQDFVRVAGTKVGEVVDMKLVGNTVEVTFTADGIRLGQDARASINTQTLLGKRFLGLEPGTGPELAERRIPLGQTSAPYNVSATLQKAGRQLQGFDDAQIEQALNTFADAFQDTPANFRATFQNVKDLSLSISSRDAALRELLAHANEVSKVLADRTESFEQILIDGSTLLAELQRRQEVVDKFFRDFTYVAEQARQFVKENNANLGPVLDELNEFLEILEQNNANLRLSIQRVGAFITGLGEGVANGPGFMAEAGLHTFGDIFNYTDVLRQLQNPQAPRVPATPCLPGGGDTPNPLYAPPSGSGADEPLPPPEDACGVPDSPEGN